MSTLKKEGKVFVMAGVMLAMFLSSLDQTIVSTAMPQIVQDLNGLVHMSWVFTAYMLASTITVPLYGKLSDLYGRRGLYMAGIVIFLLGSALSGLSTSMIQLILFRALQGIGAGAIMVNSIAIIGDLFPPAERGRWQGMIFGVFGLSSIAGPLLGGWITDHSSWRWVFYVNLPLGIIALSVIASVLPKIIPDIRTKAIDYAGAFFLALGLIPMLLAFVWGGNEYAWDSWQILGSFGLSIASLITFFTIEKSAAEPIISLSLFKNRTFNVSVAATFLSSMAMFGAILYIPLFAQGVIGVSATNSGLILTPMMIGLIIASIISGQIISRTGTYKALAVGGSLISLLGMYLFSTITSSTSEAMLSLRMVILGLGLGATMPIFTIVVQSAFEHRLLGEVTAATQMFRSIGGTVGTAVLGSIMNHQLSDRIPALIQEPFVQTVHQLGQGMGDISTTTIQGLLTPAGQHAIEKALSLAPLQYRQLLLDSFGHFLSNIKIAFTQSLDHVFIFATFVAALAFLITLFLPQIPLRTSNATPPIGE